MCAVVYTLRMNSDIVGNTNEQPENEYEIHMNRFRHFRQDYLKLKKMYEETCKENELIEKWNAALESKLRLVEVNSSFTDIIKQQNTIVDYLQKKDEYLEMQNLCDTLQNKIRDLETKLQSQKTFHEQEIKQIIAKTTEEMADLRKDSERLVTEKIRQLEMSNRELIRENEVLKALLDNMSSETENEKAQMNAKYDEEIIKLKERRMKLESENKLLIDKLIEQEKWFKGRLQLFEEQNNKFVNKLVNDNHKRSFMQTLDEVLCINENVIKQCENPKKGRNTPENLALTPYVTDDNNY